MIDIIIILLFNNIVYADIVRETVDCVVALGPSTDRRVITRPKNQYVITVFETLETCDRTIAKIYVNHTQKKVLLSSSRQMVSSLSAHGRG
jgi:hypothetical protein